MSTTDPILSATLAACIANGWPLVMNLEEAARRINGFQTEPSLRVWSPDRLRQYIKDGRIDGVRDERGYTIGLYHVLAVALGIPTNPKTKHEGTAA
jgi:hypothetical protein